MATLKVMLIIHCDWNPHHSRFLIQNCSCRWFVLCGNHGQVRSLTGAAHLSNASAGVVTWAPWEKTSHADPKGEKCVRFSCSERLSILVVRGVISETSRKSHRRDNHGTAKWACEVRWYFVGIWPTTPCSCVQATGVADLWHCILHSS